MDVPNKVDYKNLTGNLSQVLFLFRRQFGDDNICIKGIPSEHDMNNLMENLDIIDVIPSESWKRVFPNGVPPEFNDLAINSGKIDKLECLKEFCGNIYILVRFPNVTVSNENGESIEITDLFVRVPITIDGVMNGKFSLMRTSYTNEQLEVGYLHSHTSTIGESTIMTWRDCCLGSGPIIGVISSLNIGYDYDQWALFCFELNRYVHTESIGGGPYIKLSSVRKRTEYHEVVSEAEFYKVEAASKFMPRMTNYHGDQIIELANSVCYTELSIDMSPHSPILNFMVFLFNRLDSYGISFRMNGNHIELAMPVRDFYLNVSRAYVDFIKDEYKLEEPEDMQEEISMLLDDGVLLMIDSSYDDDRIHYLTEGSESSSVVDNSRFNGIKPLIGKDELMFNGKIYKLSIVNKSGVEEKERKVGYILSTYFLSTLLSEILKNININYGRKEETYIKDGVRIY